MSHIEGKKEKVRKLKEINNKVKYKIKMLIETCFLLILWTQKHPVVSAWDSFVWKAACRVFHRNSSNPAYHLLNA